MREKCSITQQLSDDVESPTRCVPSVRSRSHEMFTVGYSRDVSVIRSELYTGCPSVRILYRGLMKKKHSARSLLVAAGSSTQRSALSAARYDSDCTWTRRTAWP